MTKRINSRVGLDDAIVRSHARHSEGCVRDDLVQEVGAMLQLLLGAIARSEHGERIAVQQHHARYRQQTEPAADGGLELVETVA